MKITTILFIALSCAFAALAQTPAPTPVIYSEKTISDLELVRRESLASDFGYMSAGYLSNNIGPRLSGSPQAARAVEWVAEEMRRLGLDVRLQKVMVPHWVRGEERGELVSWDGMAAGTTQKIVLATLGGSVATPADGLTAEIVVVSSYEELEKLGADKVRGKIVLFNVKFDRRLAELNQAGAAYGQVTAYRGGGASAAAKLGAVAVLVRSAGGSQNRLAHTGSLRYADGVAKIPAAAVPFEDAELIAWLARTGPVKMKLKLTPQSFPDVESFNVIADLKGSDKPDEVVVIGGHLDSWDLGTGAIDDAAGVAMAMQTMKTIRGLGLKPKRTIRLVAFMNEENGFRGADTYASEADAAKHVAAIEGDLGASAPIGFIFAGKPDAMPFLRPIAEVLNRQGAGQIDQKPSASSDIGRLTEKGVPSFSPWFDTRTYFNYHHTAADTFDKIDPRAMAENCSVMAVLAYGLANAERTLPR